MKRTELKKENKVLLAPTNRLRGHPSIKRTSGLLLAARTQRHSETRERERERKNGLLLSLSWTSEKATKN